MCDKYIDNISLYIDDMLDTNEALELEAHMENCKDCQLVYDNILTLKEMLDNMDDITFPKDLHSNIMTAVNNSNESLNKNTKKVIKIDFRKYSAIVASVVALLFVFSPVISKTLYKDQPNIQLMIDPVTTKNEVVKNDTQQNPIAMSRLANTEDITIAQNEVITSNDIQTTPNVETTDNTKIEKKEVVTSNDNNQSPKAMSGVANPQDINIAKNKTVPSNDIQEDITVASNLLNNDDIPTNNNHENVTVMSGVATVDDTKMTKNDISTFSNTYTNQSILSILSILIETDDIEKAKTDIIASIDNYDYYTEYTTDLKSTISFQIDTDQSLELLNYVTTNYPTSNYSQNSEIPTEDLQNQDTSSKENFITINITIKN